MLVFCIVTNGGWILAEASSPTVQVPFVEKQPTIDGTVNKDEWKYAAVIQDFQIPSEGAWTRLYIQYDKEAILIAAVMGEPNEEFPLAFPRGPHEDWSVDDSLLIGIGLDGKHEKTKLSMGGYEGASSDLGTLEHLYKFRVNSIGTAMCIYNDYLVIDQSESNVKISTDNHIWAIEMRIPFSILKVNKVFSEGMSLYFNAVRFRPPNTLGWHGMSKWGGFTRFPLGKMVLLPKDINSNERTLEKAPAQMEQADNNIENQVPPRIDYYPLSNEIVAIFSVKNKAEATIKAGSRTLKKWNNLRPGKHRLGVTVKSYAIHKGEEISLTVRESCTNTKLNTKYIVLEKSSKPDWCNSQAGAEYLYKKTPGPWLQPHIKDKTIIKLAHCEINLGNNALPESIKNREVGEILASPIYITCRREDEPLKVNFSRSPKIEICGNSVEATATGTIEEGGVLRVLTKIDFDGFMTVQLQVDGNNAFVDNLQINLPLIGDASRFVNNSGISQFIYKLGKYPYHSSFKSYLWVGGHDRGLTITNDMEAFRSKNKRDQIVIEPGADNERLVTLTFTDDHKQLLETNGVLQFYIQPTPVRPPSHVTDNDYKMIFEQWSDYQGYPDLRKLDTVRKFADKTRAGGKVPLVYFSQMLAKNSPGFDDYSNELLALPTRMWYKRAYNNPGKGIPCYVCCVRGPYGDLLLNGIQKLRDVGLGGIYMDGTTVAWDCNNPSHDRCVSRPPNTFGKIQIGRLIGTRRFLKRLRGIFEKDDLPTILVGHTGGALNPNTLGFVDYFWEGEWLGARLPGYQIPLYRFSVAFSGVPWGWRTMFYARHWLKGRGDNFALLYALLHGSDLYHGKAYSLYEQYGNPWTACPYWSNRLPINIESKEKTTVASIYKSLEKPLVVIGNIGGQKDEIEINLESIFGGADVLLKDLFTGAVLQLNAGILKASIEPFKGLALTTLEDDFKEKRIKRDVTAIKPVTIEEYHPDDWSKAKNSSGNVIPVTILGNRGCRLKSLLHHTSTRINLRDVEFNDNLVANLIVRIEERFVLRLGKTSFRHVGSWQLDGELDGWNNGHVSKSVPVTNKPQKLHIHVKDNVWNVTLDGKSIVSSVKMKRGSSQGNLSIETWGGDSLGFSINLITNDIQADNNEALHKYTNHLLMTGFSRGTGSGLN